ncbi:MAG: hypothetical protein SFZ23_04205 [Planctomycetota bacterium]|nr:hypothetical protein [Planctomycetota bacterium]
MIIRQTDITRSPGQSTAPRASWRRWLPVLLPFLVLVLPACNIVGPAYYFISGPEKMPRAYELPKDRLAVVFIDDRDNRLPRRSLRLTIAEAAEKALLRERVVKEMVRGADALAVVAGEKAGEPMSIVEVGRALRTKDGRPVDLMIYVAIDAFSLTPDGEEFYPTASMSVKVIDPVADQRLWPADKLGFPLNVTPKRQAKGAPRSTSEIAKAQNALAEFCGTAVAELFFETVARDSTRAPG